MTVPEKRSSGSIRARFFRAIRDDGIERNLRISRVTRYPGQFGKETERARNDREELFGTAHECLGSRRPSTLAAAATTQRLFPRQQNRIRIDPGVERRFLSPWDRSRKSEEQHDLCFR